MSYEEVRDEAVHSLVRNWTLETGRQIPVRTVSEIRQNRTKPAVVRTRTIEYASALDEVCSATASDAAEVKSQFDFVTVHDGGPHLEQTVYLKSGYPLNAAVDATSYVRLLQDVLFDVSMVNDAGCELGEPHLSWNDGPAFTRWHADILPLTVAVWAQLQRGQKMWWVAPGRRNHSWFMR